ncbi:hypothetical protein [Streptomyces cavernae]|uniref:hypothetical protein n=1 Tax=Streptomyces cavernae TaxID=2259034 RepID=UPI00192E5D90|nr:hypothetical protein [Streptomyces cavernae]
MRRKNIVQCAAVLALVAGGLLTGCSQNYADERGKGDAPVKGKKGDDTAAEVYNMPDDFSNLATKCVGHGFRAYVTTQGWVEIVKDESCAS